MADRLPRPMKQAEILARTITDEIVADGLPAGAKLPNEREMLESYAVGRSTMREALRLMENWGVVTIRSGRDGGPFVRRPRPSDLGGALTLLMQFEQLPFAEIYAARQALEPMLARMAATRMTAETLALLEQCNQAIAADLDDRALFRRENLRFHDLVANAAANPVLSLFLAALESVAGGLAFGVLDGQFTREQRARSLEAHRELIKTFAARNPDAADDAMRAHLTDGRANWRAAYGDLWSRSVQWSSLPPPAR